MRARAGTHTRGTCECYPAIPAAAVTSHSRTRTAIQTRGHTYTGARVTERACKVSEIVCSVLCARTSAPRAALCTRIIVLYDSFITRRYTARLLHIDTLAGFFFRAALKGPLRARRRSIGARRIFAMSASTFPPCNHGMGIAVIFFSFPIL